jgi:alpha-mannosidase
VFHKWCGIKNEDDALYVVNNGIYGGSFTDNCIKLSLLRTPIYAAHPIQQRQIAPHDRFINHIDMGERHFSFRITTEKNIARAAQIYNEAPELLSIFTSGEGEKKTSAVTIDNPEIILSSFRANDNGYELHLHNAADHENDALLSIPATNTAASLHFGKHELKIMKI